MLNNKAEVKPQKRVLIIGDKLLLGAGVESLLSRDESLELVGVDASDELTLGEVIERIQPQVVIVDEIIFFADPLKLLSPLVQSLKLKLIVVSANSDLVEIYEKQQFLVTQTADLVRIVQKSNLQSPYSGDYKEL